MINGRFGVVQEIDAIIRDGFEVVQGVTSITTTNKFRIVEAVDQIQTEKILRRKRN